MGGGWRTAEARLARAPAGDMMEVYQSLGRVPYETLVFGRLQLQSPSSRHPPLSGWYLVGSNRD
jgi:hypothetical protein